MLLLHAFAEVRAQDPCRLLLMGEGPLLAELRAEAHRLGVAGDVQFLGWQDNPYPYMQRADAFVLSSNHEGFPSVLVEAMACGCPVISTDCPSGPAEILNPNGASCCGQLVPTGDAAALAAAMREVVRNPAAAQRMAARATERIEAFRLEKIAPEFEDLIRMAAQA
jgi:glycosyltransferase involved in cell wall biosynthesis